MEKRKIGGEFVKKFFHDEKQREVDWPNSKTEFIRMVDSGGYKIDGLEFKVSWESICGSAWRGESLKHQGNPPMTPEAKEKAKEQRKQSTTIFKGFSSLPKEDHLALILKLEAAGHDCSLLRSGYSHPPKSA